MEMNNKFCTKCGKEITSSNGECTNCAKSAVKNNNTPALLGFIFSIIGCLALPGLIFSVIGLVDAQKYKNKRKGLAIFGIIISGIWILLTIYIINSDVFTVNTTNQKGYSEKSRSVKKVEVIDFRSMSKDDVQSWCDSNNVTCSFETEYSDTVAVDGFVSQSVAVGQEIEENSYIKIVYSLGHKKTAEEIKNEYKALCNKYTYDEISRNPDNYKGKTAVLRGKVIQVMESSYSSYIEMRVDVTEGEYGLWDDTIYVTYYLPEGNPRILEDDIITMYGTLDGLYSYTSVLGATITLPKLNVKYIE